MQKIMFNDEYVLTQAVLEGRKTHTRRIIPLTPEDEEYLSTAFDWELRESVIIERYARYKVGEEVAVAQRYLDFRQPNGDVTEEFYKLCCENHMPLECFGSDPGANNKMFVKPALMPHRIKITNIRVERLQDISEEDCLKEGIYLDYSDTDWDEGDDPAVCYRCIGIPEKEFGWPEKAFAYLIDKVSGKGTWESNPWVFVYDFELIK